MTVTPGKASRKRAMVCISTGLPPTEMNCLGRGAPMRNPLPPATIMT